MATVAMVPLEQSAEKTVQGVGEHGGASRAVPDLGFKARLSRSTTLIEEDGCML